MVDLKEATRLAKNLRSDISRYVEEPDAFIFSGKNDDISFGGQGPVVVIKESGICINMTAYIDECHPSVVLNEGAI